MEVTIKKIEYSELIHMFDSLDTGLVYIGGEWCNNCSDVLNLVKDIAKKHNIDTIYNYDPVFINVYGEKEDLRDCKSLEIKLKYYAIVEKSGFKSKELVKDTLIPKIHVPFYMAIKNGTCQGYYTIELYKDNGILHELNSNIDKTEEFKEKIDELLSKLEIKNRKF